LSKCLSFPILWKYLWKEFIKIFALSFFSFIAIILVFKLHDIAKFATLGVSFLEVIVFSLYQIPCIFPLALPLSCLFATLFLFHELSSSYEITALRSSGLSLLHITAPLMLIGALLCLLTTFIAFEIAPTSRLRSKEMLDKIKFNPLFLFSKNNRIKLKNYYIEMSNSDTGKEIKDLLFFAKNSTGQLYALTAKKVCLKNQELQAYNLGIITAFASNIRNNFNHLYIENQKKFCAPAFECIAFLLKEPSSLPNEYLSTKTLLAKTMLEKSVKKKSSRKAKFEVMRRLSLSCFSFTFIIMGMSFGLHVGRMPSYKKSFFCFCLTASTFCCFLIGKSFQKNPIISAYFYFIPHLAILIFSFLLQRKLNLGLER